MMLCKEFRITAKIILKWRLYVYLHLLLNRGNIKTSAYFLIILLQLQVFFFNEIVIFSPVG